MILQALKEYYDRKAADPDSGIAPLGWEWKELPFLITLLPDGSPFNIEDTRVPDGKKLRATRFLVPQAVKRTFRKSANLLWDDPEYALALAIKGDPENAAEKHRLFIERITSVDLSDIDEVAAVLAFLKRTEKCEELASLDPAKYEDLKKASFISFKISGEAEPVFRNPEVVARISSRTPDDDTRKSLCLISGAMDELDLTHPAIKGVRGANTTGGNIVSFNAAAFCSFGKEQGANAPVGKTASFAYTTALNTLLGKDSKQKLQVGDATTVFWSEKKGALEEAFVDFWSEPPKDDPDRLCNAVAALFASVETGAFATDDADTKFYVLGLSPNAARISVRFWHIATVAELAAHMRTYFEDLRIVHGARDKDDLSLWRLLISTAVQGKSENIAPNLAGDVMRSILDGQPFPATLLQAAILRIKAERDVTYPRAKLIKGCLNRKSRTNPNNKERMLTMSLDKDNTHVGYRLGRLFAVLEKIQQEANPGINATIRDKFYASASSTPSTVFGNLMRLKNHHLSKLDNPGRRIWFEKLLGEIVAELPEFPAHLKLDDQGRFAIGYYHQVQDLWTKKSDKE
ncbi:MAG TPA: type I-C CRISPR-associated protein Cas8c/Csd1 [Kiritimatiellia bacterium]|nr:type I-C CRISPR-associated protein Cas8c/Csd1 [Kiritimatiellia bacterium]